MRRSTRASALLLALCLLLSACGQRRREPELNVIDDKYRNWYEVFVYSYYDSDGDRIGATWTVWRRSWTTSPASA